MTTTGKPMAQPRIRAVYSADTAREAHSSVEVFERLSQSALIFSPPERTAMRGLTQALANMAAPISGRLETAHGELNGA